MSSMNELNLKNVEVKLKGKKSILLSPRLELLRLGLMIAISLGIYWLTSWNAFLSILAGSILVLSLINESTEWRFRSYAVDYQGVFVVYGKIKFRLFLFKDIKEVSLVDIPNYGEILSVKVKGSARDGNVVISCDELQKMKDLISNWK